MCFSRASWKLKVYWWALLDTPAVSTVLPHCHHRLTYFYTLTCLPLFFINTSDTPYLLVSCLVYFCAFCVYFCVYFVYIYVSLFFCTSLCVCITATHHGHPYTTHFCLDSTHSHYLTVLITASVDTIALRISAFSVMRHFSPLKTLDRRYSNVFRQYAHNICVQFTYTWSVKYVLLPHNFPVLHIPLHYRVFKFVRMEIRAKLLLL